MKSETKKIVMTALMAALICVVTLAIKIPSPLKGYLNLGDCVVLIAGWTLSFRYGFLAAGLGSAFADIFSGYVFYAPVTFVIKGLMAIIAFAFIRIMQKRMGVFFSRLLGGVLAEFVMVAGYYIFEGFLYGFGPSCVNIPGNCMQGIAGLVLGIVLIKAFEKAKLIF